jgi:MoxR-like ATPase
LCPLGRVFAAEERHVLLIDEIDKADLEFPNDLLLELDEMRFKIIETGDEITAKHRPIVLITSNNEKELPDAFLRRCADLQRLLELCSLTETLIVDADGFYALASFNDRLLLDISERL